jgi:hypothetical protein
MKDKSVDKNVSATSFLEELREFALVVGEDCPEGHRRDPGSGRCLPMGSTDHTAFTRSVNVDDGPAWRGEETKDNETFADEQEIALDADEMDEPESCANGTTFSFVQRRCISVEDAEKENSEEFARDEEGNEILEEEDARNGHEEIISNQPEGRRDTVNHECPANEFFDYKRRECIPLNKDTVLASEDFTDEFKQAVATFARLAMTSPDPVDGHRHVATLDLEGNGVTSVGGHMHPHSHDVKKFNVIPASGGEGDDAYTSQHPGVAVPEEHRVEKLEDFGSQETAAPLKGGQRKALPDSAFGVPGKRKFPLDTCARVRNAMARFNQGKGLTSGEKAALRRKILSRAKACSIEVRNFGKANTVEEFAAVVQELIAMETKTDKTRLEAYRAAAQKQGPCPPGMNWDSASLRCTKVRGFVEEVANHADIVRHQPEGRRDPVGFNCPDGHFFDFTNRRCLPLDPSRKPGTTTTKASDEESAQRDLAPSPAGRPARLPQDCPTGTIWDKDLEKCKPLDSRKKTKSAEEEEAAIPPQFLKNIKKKKGKNGKNGKNGDDEKKGLPPFMKKKMKSEEEESQTTSVGPGKEKDDHGCDAATETYNVKLEKCVKSRSAKAEHNPSNREGLTTEVPGRVKTPMECPPGTAWNAVRRVCSPLSSMDKNRPDGGAGPQNSKDMAAQMSTAQLIQALDEIIKEAVQKEKSKVLAKDLPNAAFPPSLVSDTCRSLMHHTPEVSDPYDTASVDVARLRNSLFRATTVKGFSDKAVEDAIDHLLFHAREIVAERLEKKA